MLNNIHIQHKKVTPKVLRRIPKSSWTEREKYTFDIIILFYNRAFGSDKIDEYPARKRIWKSNSNWTRFHVKPGPTDLEIITGYLELYARHLEEDNKFERRLVEMSD